MAAVVVFAAIPTLALASPTATTEAATDLQAPQVTLNGTVNPGGEDTTYRFEYGTTTAYGQSVPVPGKAIGSGTSGVKVAQQIGSLEAATTYHFRLVAENSQGTAVGEDKSFTTPEWAIVDTDTPEGAKASALAGAACISPTDCTVVGNYQDEAGTFVTLAERRNGGEWSIQATPNPAGASESRLRSVSCTSSTACVAVGHYKNAAGTFLTLAERWNGSAWSILATPNPAGAQESRLESVSCVSATDCTAVGYYKTGTEAFSTLVQHYNGSAWSIVASPNPAALPKHYLRSVSCATASDCWAVGQSFPPPPNRAQAKCRSPSPSTSTAKRGRLSPCPKRPATSPVSPAPRPAGALPPPAKWGSRCSAGTAAPGPR